MGDAPARMPASTASAGEAAPLTVAAATAVILDGVAPLPAEEVPLDQAIGRILAATVHAPRDLPPWPNASMDGYAVRASDLEAAHGGDPVSLRVTQTIPAGTLPTRTLGPGEAARVMTGAPVPAGADTVIRIEDTDRGRETVTIHARRDLRANVRPSGEDLRAGATVAAAGAVIRAGTLGALAAAGAARVRVHRRPRVALLSAGDELVPLEEQARAAAERKIVDVNSHTLAALAAEAGAEVVALGLAGDDPDDLRARLAGAPPHDLLLTSGGVSVGDHDHARRVLRELGAEILVHRVRIRPGAPLAFGRIGDRRWLGLPGNPVSAMVTFELFARPLLRRLAGDPQPFRATVTARVTEEIRTAAPLTHFLRATLAPAADGVYDAALTGPQGSGLITSMARADGLLIVPEDRRVVPAGTLLRAIPLGDAHAWSARQVA